MIFKSGGIFVLGVVLSLEGAETAERNGTDSEDFPRFLIGTLEYRRSETYAEFVYFEAEQFTREVVPEFVDDDHEHQRAKREQNVAYGSHHLFK